MITFNPDVTKKPQIFPSTQETFDTLESYLAPLQRSKNTADRNMYARAIEHISYFRARFGLEPLQDTAVKINNWQFLQLLAMCWRELNIANSDRATPSDITHRIGLEDAAVRVMSKYGVCYTNLFKGQTHYSIFGFDPALLNQTLEDVLTLKEQLSSQRDRKS